MEIKLPERHKHKLLLLQLWQCSAILSTAKEKADRRLTSRVHYSSQSLFCAAGVWVTQKSGIVSPGYFLSKSSPHILLLAVQCWATTWKTPHSLIPQSAKNSTGLIFSLAEDLRWLALNQLNPSLRLSVSFENTKHINSVFWCSIPFSSRYQVDFTKGDLFMANMQSRFAIIFSQLSLQVQSSKVFLFHAAVGKVDPNFDISNWSPPSITKSAWGATDTDECLVWPFLCISQ